MKLQTEHLDNHIAQMTVGIDEQEFQKAKKSAARRLSKRVNIPGFRKGKAPYRIISNYIGEAAIIEEAVDVLGNNLYKDALEEAELNPYGPGSIDNFELEPEPTIVFSVPLQPEVDLKDYKDIRLDFEIPEVTDEDVDKAMKALQQREALIEESSRPVEVGNQVTIDIHSEVADGEERPEASEAEERDSGESDDDTEEKTVIYKGDQYYHRHDLTIQLNKDGEDEPLMPGFVDALVGANVDETLEFDLTFPDDEEEYKEFAGRTIHFNVDIKKIETVTLPELNDAFAAKITAEEDEPLTLLQLRIRMRENLEEEAKRRAESEYADSMLEKVIEGAEIRFPEMMVEERIDDLMEELDGNLRQQGITLEDYKRVLQVEEDSIRDQYRERATDLVKRSLSLMQLLADEEIKISSEAVEERINTVALQFGPSASAFRDYLESDSMRTNIANDLLVEQVMNRLVKRGQGLEIVEDVDEDDTEDAEAETVTEDTVSDVSDEEDETDDSEDESDETEAVADEEAE